jgi:uncharacterized protein
MTANSVEEYFQQGIDLFNQGLFFDSHEAWEQAWLRSSGQEKLFYQGLIQAAAAILHAQRGNVAGSGTLWAEAIEKLGPLPDVFMAIALEDLRAGLERFFDQAVNIGTALPQPPRITRRGD